MESITVNNLTKVFHSDFLRKPILAVDNLSFSVEEGEIFGFLGPNGAGKTTTIKILVGLLKPTSGSAKILGIDISDVNSHEFIGFLPEMPNFYDYLTGYELMDYFSRLFNLRGSHRIKRIEELLRLAGVWEARNQPLRSYSKGMLQRIGIAQALINDPKLLILDEPMSGLDPIGRKDVRDLILSLKEQSKTIFFSTHIIPDVELICDKIAILNKGKLISIGKLDELSALKGELYEIAIEGCNSNCLTRVKTIADEIIQRGEVYILRVRKEKKEDAIGIIKDARVPIRSIVPIRRSLEELFIKELQNQNMEN